MKIEAITPWFGGKRNLAPRIVEALGLHGVYWEPFCGSLAVLFAKAPCAMETVNDLHGDLINLARCVQDEAGSHALFAASRRVLFHEALYDEAAARLAAAPRPEEEHGFDAARALDYLVVSWFGRNGVAGSKSYGNGFCVRYTSNGGHSATRWMGVVDSIPAWHDRLRGVTILRRDAFALLERIEDRSGTVIYCDPPYLVKGASYVHDFTELDHERLADGLRRFARTRVVVSYYEHPKLEALYPGWSRRRIDVTKAMASQAGARADGPVRAVEVLLSNHGMGDEAPFTLGGG